VAVTGDGVNDAAALHQADVGFAMGSGTEMAKEASDIVILDDNFSSITKAILYGRTIFKTIRKFIVFQSTINLASTLIVFIGPFLGFDFPLSLIQLLWVNLVMDTLAALAFGGEPALERYMKEPPIKRDDKIINQYMWTAILFNGIFVAIVSIMFLLRAKPLFRRNGEQNEAVFLTAFFAFYIFITTINAFNVRTTTINIFDNLSGNKGFSFVLILIFAVQMIFTYIGGSVLRTVPLESGEWINIIIFSLAIIPFDILRKLVFAPMLTSRKGY
jgi:magnesium-transporting ATPase (P-type)